MKNFKYICLLIATIILTGCEEVVDVDLDTAEPRLVVDAFIKFERGTTGNEQTIKLTTTTGFYEPEVPAAFGATVFVTDTDNNLVFNFVETPGTGEYICLDFEPILNTNYTLTVVYNDETYTASEKLLPVPAIDFIEQKNDGGFTGEDIEIRTFFTDDGTTNDFYLIRYDASFAAIPDFEATDDEFYQGNQFSDFYFNEEMESGATLDITLHGISQQYFNYMTILIGISGGGGGPFGATPVKIRGNIVNTTDEDNYALGYFSLSQTAFRSYIVQ